MKIYLVGGAVRDELLKLPVQDRDWVVVGATPKKMLHQGYQKVGRDFPVFLHPKNKEEYALARTERKSGLGYTGFFTNFNSKITLEQDLMRRDLTINAIAKNEKGQYIDPYGGQKDIKKKILRHISSSFTEDPLRILRVARFAAKFKHLGFRISKNTMQLMKSMVRKNELSTLSVERVWKETESALNSHNPNIYFKVLEECQALSILFPEFETLFKLNILSSNEKMFPILKIASNFSKKIDIRFASLCLNFVKILDQIPGDFLRYLNFIILKINQLCMRLKVPHDFRTLTIFSIKYCNFIYKIQEQKSKNIIQMFNHIDVWRKPHRIKQLALMSKIYAVGCKNLKKKYMQINLLNKFFKKTMTISVKKIIQDGFVGKEIKHELDKRRTEKLKNYKSELIN